MSPVNIVIWMNQPSHYQTAFFRELAARDGVSLSVCYGTEVAAFRKAMGWREPAEEKFPQRTLRGYFETIGFAWRHRRAVHVVNGMWSVPKFVLGSSLLLVFGASVYFHGEHPDPSMTRGGTWHWLKQAWVRLLFLRARGMFVVGRRAGDFYRRLGVPASRIIPFMYVQSGAERTDRKERAEFRVVYVGQFVHWKRVEDLIAAFGRVLPEIPNAQLALIGAGPLRADYTDLIQKLNLTGKVEIKGPLAPQEVLPEIQRAEVLVLPSKFDGWGLTINEALQAGVPAICSDTCGAAELIEDHPGWGIVYPTGDVPALAGALRQIATTPARFRPVHFEVEAVIGPAALVTRFLQVVIDTPTQPAKAAFNHGL